MNLCLCVCVCVCVHHPFVLRGHNTGKTDERQQNISVLKKWDSWQQGFILKDITERIMNLKSNTPLHHC